MKLHTTTLEKFIDLPTDNPDELRLILDDIGLEVKDIERTVQGSIFNIETLANRGDHLYALGVARELSARLLTNIKHPPVADLPDRKTSILIRRDTTRCMRFALLEMTLPKGMILREDIAGVVGREDSTKHPIVDILNYVALELGQPMHVYDRDKIEGELIVDLTKNEIEVEGLNGKTYKVPPDSFVIRDRKKVVAAAGVIGCSNSMVTLDTTRVLIEAISFDPILIRKTAKSMGLSTEASYVFERGCDVDMITPALRRVAYLCQNSGGESAQVIGFSQVDTEETEKRYVTARLPYIKKQVNLPRLQDIEVTARLKNLGYGIETSANGKELVLSVPSWRLWDVRHEEDILEDFVRSHGLNSIKPELPSLDYDIPEYNDSERILSAVEPSLTGNGFFEVISRSFYSVDDVTFLESLDKSAIGQHLALKNSIESSYSHLKNTNILHLAGLASQNIRMGVQSVKIFEFGRVFHIGKQEDEGYETDILSLCVAGRWCENEWRKPESTNELLMLLKGVVTSIFASLGREVHVSESKHKFLHPGAQGAIVSGRETCGYFGMVHPLIKSRYDLKTDLLYAELDGLKLARRVDREPFSFPIDFPAIRRDMTLKIKPHTQAGKIVNYIEMQKSLLLKDVLIIDDFKKETEDFRRVTYRLTFQNGERTLEHTEVDRELNDILLALKERHQIDLAT